jgi:two-component system, LuxR family, sensor kinase FixL
MSDSLNMSRGHAAFNEALLETTLDCIALLDLDGRLISVNEPGLAALEIDDFAGLQGQAWASLWPDEHRDEVAAAVAAAAAAGRTVRFSAFGPTARGNPKWWEVSVAPVRDAGGRPERLLSSARDVTTDRQLASQLRAEREFSRDAVEHNPHMFWVADAAGQILRVNGARLRFLGLSDDEANRTGWLKLLHPDDRAGYVEAGARASKVRGNFDHRFRLLAGDGAYRWVRSRAYPKLGDDGLIQRWYGYCEDIHDGVMAQRELVESERRLATLVGHLPGMAYRCEPDVPWRLEYASEGAEALTGYPASEFTGKRLAWAEIVHPEDTGAVSGTVAAAVAKGEKFSLTYRIIHRSGEVRWVLERGQPVYEDGTLRCLEGFIGDISEQKRNEEQLRASELRFATIFLQASVGIALSVTGQGILLANDRLGAILGREAGELRGLTSRELTHPDDLEWSQSLFEQGARTGEPLCIEKRYLRPDGSTVWCRSSFAFMPHGTDGTPLAIIVVEDISEQRATAAQLREMQSELVHVARVSAMGSVAAGLAHELNQPLTAVSNYVSGSRRLLARHGAEAHAVVDEALQRASESALLAGNIVRSLREMVQKTEPRKTPAAVADLVNNAVALTMPDRGSRTPLRIELDASMDTITADRVQIQQVLVNLLRNALEAVEHAPRKRIEITTAARGSNELVFRIEDSGPGVSAELKRQLFAPFVSTKEGGMGVGLSISKTIVENHGGELWVEDAPGGGAAFSFSLPLDAS